MLTSGPKELVKYSWKQWRTQFLEPSPSIVQAVAWDSVLQRIVSRPCESCCAFMALAFCSEKWLRGGPSSQLIETQSFMIHCFLMI